MNDSVVIVAGVSFIIALAFYLIGAFACYKYFKVRNYPNKWMAFVPAVNIYGIVSVTYGNVEKIKVFGIPVPAMVLKLFPIVIYVISGILAVITKIGPTLDSVLGLLSVAVYTFIYIDMLERVGEKVNVLLAIIANLIPVIGSIKLLMVCSKLKDGQFDYHSDKAMLDSQVTI